MGTAIIILALVAVMLVGLGMYMLEPINYDLYTSERVQNLTGSAAASVDLLNNIVGISFALFLGVIVIAVFARGSFGSLFN